MARTVVEESSQAGLYCISGLLTQDFYALEFVDQKHNSRTSIREGGYDTTKHVGRRHIVLDPSGDSRTIPQERQMGTSCRDPVTDYGLLRGASVQENIGGLPKIGRLLAANPEVAVFGGLGGAMFLEELRCGAAGTMTGFSYPEVLVQVYRRFRSGDVAGAATLSRNLSPAL